MAFVRKGTASQMVDIPENVSLDWIARYLIALRGDLNSLRSDVEIIAAILRRVDNNQTAFREELRLLFDMHRNLRSRVDTIERSENPL